MMARTSRTRPRDPQGRARGRLQISRELLEACTAAQGVRLGIERVEKVLEKDARKIRIPRAQCLELGPHPPALLDPFIRFGDTRLPIETRLHRLIEMIEATIKKAMMPPTPPSRERSKARAR